MATSRMTSTRERNLLMEMTDVLDSIVLESCSNCTQCGPEFWPRCDKLVEARELVKKVKDTRK